MKDFFEDFLYLVLVLLLTALVLLIVSLTGVKLASL